MTHINRRTALTAVAAIPAAAVLSAPALAGVREDAELRHLWAQYLNVLDALHRASAAHRSVRGA
jgi:hypothetical protein